MKLFVNSVLLSVFILLFSVFSSFAQTSCKCKPVPPGGKHNCQVGIAVCGVTDGTCEGYCIVISGKLNSLDYTARVFSKMFGNIISVSELKTNARKAKTVIRQILQSRGENSIDIEFKGNKIKGITVSLEDEAEVKLSEALRNL